MDDTFGKYSEYMALGYAAMALILVGMVVWIYLRYAGLRREQEQITQLEAELREEQSNSVASTVGARESQTQPEEATPGLSGMTAPDSERARTLPES